MFFSMVNAAHALLILYLMSRSVPPCLSTILPWQMKDSTSLMTNWDWCLGSHVDLNHLSSSLS